LPGVPAQQRRKKRGRKRRRGGLLPGNQNCGYLRPPGISSRTHLAVYDRACYMGSLNAGTGTVFWVILGTILGVGDSCLVNLEPFFLILGPY
jgi:hypothetical protein